MPLITCGHDSRIRLEKLMRRDRLRVDAMIIAVVTTASFVVGAIVPASAWAATRGFTVAGGNGNGQALNQFFGVSDAAVDADGNIYAVDSDRRVRRWAPGATEGVTVIDTQTVPNAGNRQAIAVDGDGRVYVTNRFGSVQRWTPGSPDLETVAGGNGTGPGPNQLESGLLGLAIDTAGAIYVSDTGNNRVQKWVPGASEGVTVAGGNGAGSRADQLWSPRGIAVDSAGNVYVADKDNSRVQRWAPGATEGASIPAGLEPDPLFIPQPPDLALDRAGNLYVINQIEGRVTMWRPGASAGVTVAGGNGLGSADNQLRGALGIGIDQFGNLYIADSGAARVQKWDLHPPTASPVASPALAPGGWASGSAPVTVDWHWSDPGGVGVDPANCQQTTTVPATGGDASAECTDLGGNVATAGPLTVKIDPSPPVAAPVVTGPTVAWHWSDGSGSGLDPATCPETSTAPGLGNQTLRGSCKDLVGNTGQGSAQVLVRAPAQLTVTPARVTAGGRLTVTGAGFLPDESVSLAVLSTPMPVGSVTASATGSFTTTVKLPSTMAAGSHSLRATGAQSALVLQAPFTLVAASQTPTPTPTPTTEEPAPQGSALPDTGPGWPLVLGGLAAATLLAAGVLLLVVARRSSRPT
jgi:hypothetical protein